MIYVCIPVHEEAATVGVLMWKIRRVLGEFGRDYQIVVHDDASQDDTAEVVERYRRKLPLKVLRSETRIGYGRSVERLLRHVVDVASYPKRDCAVVIQGDFSEDPEDVVSLVRILEGGADIVAGSVAHTKEGLPRPRRVARWLARVVLGRLWRGAPVSDPLCGLRAYRLIVLKKAFRDLPPDVPLIRSDGWAADVELLARLTPHARRVEEVELTLRHELRVRPSRFRPARTLLSLARLRGTTFGSPASPEAA